MTTKKEPPKESVPVITGSGLDASQKRLLRLGPSRGSKLVAFLFVLLLLVLAGFAYQYWSGKRSEEALKNRQDPTRVSLALINSTIDSSASNQDKAIHEQNIADAYLSGDEKTAAFEHYAKAAKYAPSNANIAIHLAKLAEELKKPNATDLYRTALALYSAEIDKNPGDFPPGTYYEAAQLAGKADNKAAEKDYYQKTVASSANFPGNAEAKGYSDLATKALAL